MAGPAHGSIKLKQLIKPQRGRVVMSDGPAADLMGPAAGRLGHRPTYKTEYFSDVCTGAGRGRHRFAKRGAARRSRPVSRQSQTANSWFLFLQGWLLLAGCHQKAWKKKEAHTCFQGSN